MVVLSGLFLGLMGPPWWHGSSVGHFVNGLHFWTAQLFFFTMVVHLWGKFCMGAWRGRRVLTWVTGVVAFLASVGAAFTGYLVQPNFDSQWISCEAKDGLNSVGIGACSTSLDLGQSTLPRHPAPGGGHGAGYLARAAGAPHGVVPPIGQASRRLRQADAPAAGPRERDHDHQRRKRATRAAPLAGRYVRYDLVKELVIALGVIAA